jgi:3-hydroxyisobutyrate dehydrogenase-like beta-hydroxyacid dehydrogenase
MESLGFIGLGAMGAPMALNLLAAGYHVTVYARRPASMDVLVAAGAHPARSPADVASRSGVIHVMVTDTEAVTDVVLGVDGVRDGAAAGAVVIDHSTISPAASRRIAADLHSRGIEMLDAPVSGGTAGATGRTLAIMVGGNEAAFERCRPILGTLGQTIVYIGGNGAGLVAKACNQIALIVNQLGAAEAMLLAERCGVDPLRVKDALMGGFASSRMLDLQAPKMIRRDFTGSVESRLHHKDILIALDMARQLGLDLPAAALASDILARLQEAGGARQDSAAIYTILDK